MRAVLFDFHGTLAQVEEPARAVVAAAARCGHDLDDTQATVLAQALVAAGFAGSPFPREVPAHLVDLWRHRDLTAEAHRACYTGIAATVAGGVDGLPTALYDRMLSVDGWRAYADTLPVLRALRRAGVPVGVVSNIGFDIRPVVAGLGFADLVDTYALSYELGVCKPEPGIFQAACAALGVPPEATLMVGDTPSDAGAVAAGCRCLILPVSPAGATHGLAAVLDLTRVTPDADPAGSARRAPR